MELRVLMDELDKLYEHKPIRMRDGYSLIPEFSSYRGYYEQLAIDYTDEPADDFTVRDFKNLLEEALDQGTMEGYKGGTFSIDCDTEVVLANYGCSGGFFIAEFIEREDDVYMAVGDI